MTRFDQVCEVVITADSEEWLISFTRSLVTERLAACGQHVTPIRSIYRWNDEIQQDSETRVALHTRPDLVPEILDRVKHEHPYEVPCVVALPITTGNPDYLDWVIAETRDPRKSTGE
jgi:periplasmic divalent cation tolerance protein